MVCSLDFPDMALLDWSIDNECAIMGLSDIDNSIILCPFGYRALHRYPMASSRHFSSSIGNQKKVDTQAKLQRRRKENLNKKQERYFV